MTADITTNRQKDPWTMAKLHDKIGDSLII